MDSEVENTEDTTPDLNSPEIRTKTTPQSAKEEKILVSVQESIKEYQKHLEEVKKANQVRLAELKAEEERKQAKKAEAEAKKRAKKAEIEERKRAKRLEKLEAESKKQALNLESESNNPANENSIPDEKQNLGYYYPDANDDIRLLHCY